MKQPTVTTDNLQLRGFRLDDAKAVQTLAGNYNVARHTLNIPHPYEDGTAESWISTHSEGWKNRTEITYAITLNSDDDSVIGAVSLLNISENEAELGYWIGEPFWGNGFCTEATNKLIETAFKQWNIDSFYAIHLQRNPASGAVMKKSGMTKTETVEINDRDGVLSPVDRYCLSLAR
jgi:RimJ/RimL family protein N-acetyltransferase